MATCDCGNEIVPPTPGSTITASGGWCAPADTTYSMPDLTAGMCSSCRADFMMLLNGIPPGLAGPIPREDIQFKYGNR